MPLWLWLAAGWVGGSLSVARFLLDAAVVARTASEFPWGTFVVNVTGSFALGVFTGAALSGSAAVLVGTAGIGSYTTFSTWMLETHRLGENDDRRPLVLYLAGSLVVGLAAAAAGHAIGEAA